MAQYGVNPSLLARQNPRFCRQRSQFSTTPGGKNRILIYSSSSSSSSSCCCFPSYYHITIILPSHYHHVACSRCFRLLPNRSKQNQTPRPSAPEVLGWRRDRAALGGRRWRRCHGAAQWEARSPRCCGIIYGMLWDVVGIYGIIWNIYME